MNSHRLARACIASDAVRPRPAAGPVGPAAGGAVRSTGRDFDFLECAPENWIGVGGKLRRCAGALSARHPLVCHGLSLSLGGFAPLDETFLDRVRRFLDRHHVALYSEHLSYCADDGQLYDLLPIPFTDEAVHHVAARIRQAQDIVGRRIAVENVSYYAAPAWTRTSRRCARSTSSTRCWRKPTATCCSTSTTSTSTRSTIATTPTISWSQLPGERIAYIHVAGHYDEADDLKVDTHGAPVKDDVWALLGAPTTLRPAPDAAGARLQLPAVCRTGRRTRHDPRASCARMYRSAQPHAMHAPEAPAAPARAAVRADPPPARSAGRSRRPPASRSAASRSTATCCSTTSRACSPAISR